MEYYDMHSWGVDGYPGEFLFGDEFYMDEYYSDERWKPIFGDDRYFISNYARVWSCVSDQFMKVKPMDKHGHLGVCLMYNGRPEYYYIHRLVAQHFIPNPNNYPVVRHLDDNPYNNELENLCWGTQRDNAFDSIRNGRAYFLTDEDREKGFEKVRIPIRAIDLRTGQDYIFRGQNEAARALHIQQANIWKVLNGQRPQTQGYRFEYLHKDGGR